MENVFNIDREEIITAEDYEGYKKPEETTEETPVGEQENNTEEQVEEVEEQKEESTGEQAIKDFFGGSGDDDTQKEEEEDKAPEEGDPKDKDPDTKEEDKEEDKEEQPIAVYSDLAKEAIPDAEFKDEQEARAALQEYIKKTQDERKVTEEHNKIFVELFETPGLVSLLRMVKEGASMEEALPYVIDIEDIKPKEGDPDWEKWQKAKTHREKEKAAQEKKSQVIRTNLEKSYKEMDEFFVKEQLPKDVQTEYLAMFDKVLSDVSNGLVSKDTMERLMKGLLFDKKIKEATTKAEVKGRNEAIKEKIKKEVLTPKGDGLPAIKSASTAPMKETEEGDTTSSISRNIDDFSRSLSRF